MSGEGLDASLAGGPGQWCYVASPWMEAGIEPRPEWALQIDQIHAKQCPMCKGTGRSLVLNTMLNKAPGSFFPVAPAQVAPASSTAAPALPSAQEVPASPAAQFPGAFSEVAAHKAAPRHIAGGKNHGATPMQPPIQKSLTAKPVNAKPRQISSIAPPTKRQRARPPGLPPPPTTRPAVVPAHSAVEAIAEERAAVPMALPMGFHAALARAAVRGAEVSRRSSS